MFIKELPISSIVFCMFIFSSRLVCQVELSKEMDGLTVIVPAATNDARN